jgi:hypothetical protein
VAGACNRQKVSGKTPSLRASRLQLGKTPSGISLDPAPALRQNFKNHSIRAVFQIFHQPKKLISRFFLVLTDKQEFCVTKRRLTKVT